jgi:4-alpha-glucanotransferase
MRDTGAWGVERGYWDALGQWRTPPPATLERILDSMGADDGGPPGLRDDNPVWVVRQGDRVRIDGRWRLFTEDGGDEIAEGRLPRDLALGYHRLRRETDGREVRLIVSPGQCHLPPDLFAWGWAAQLYAVRSASSWGMGDLGDLARLGRWARGQGAGLVLVNPLHAVNPDLPQQASPYYAGSRAFRNPLYIDVEAVEGFDPGDPDLARLVKEAHVLNHARVIDRDAVYELKLEALERLWHQRRERFDVDLAAYIAEGGAALQEHATFTALAEVHGRPWTSWPADVRRPEGPGISEFQRSFSARIDFHQWVQWLADRQLAAAGVEIGLLQDLAIGVDPAGSDAWRWQDAMAMDMRVGAPPDEFNTQGQDWGLPPFDPWRLRLTRFQPYIETLRAMFRHSAGLRIDHVMGLFRLFWIPSGGSPAEGTYVRYPFEEMLDILALESVRAGAYVVGEDLGTVEDEVRAQLAERRVLSYRLLWFEPERPAQYPSQSLAAVTTHDLPTVAGLFSGRDLQVQRAIGMEPNEPATRQLIKRVARWSDLADNPSPEAAVHATHRLLAESPSMLVTATLEDALAVEERPNYPGTTTERPNWSVALPVSLEEMETHPGPAAVAEILSGRVRPQPPV